MIKHTHSLRIPVCPADLCNLDLVFKTFVGESPVNLQC